MSSSTIDFHPPYAHRPDPGQRPWYQKLFGWGRPDLAQVALENHLAKRAPGEIGAEELGEIVRRYSLSGKQVRALTAAIYRTAYIAALEDDTLTDSESQYLHALYNLLGVHTHELKKLEEEIAHPKFNRAVAEVLRDRTISDEEAGRLSALSRSLTLTPAIADALLNTSVKELISSEWHEIISDQRVSPIELERFGRLAKDLRKDDVQLDETTKAQGQLYALYWQVENGHLPAFIPPIALTKNETCHYSSSATWCEPRTRTVRTDYHGASYRIRIAKGLSYRIGTVQSSPVRQEYLATIDTGAVYFTSKRIIFDGQTTNKTIRLSSLIGFEPYSDGVSLEKSTGKNPVLLVHGNVELGHLILSELLARV